MPLEHRAGSLPARKRRIWILGALTGALPIAVHAARVLPRFDGLYGQDPYAYFAYAVGPLLDSLRAGAPVPPFHWPPGYPLLVVLASLVVGPTPLAGQLVSVVAGLLVPLLTLLLAREVLRPAGSVGEMAPGLPLLAGLIAGFTPQLGQSSVVVMTDTTSLAAATLGVWSLTRYVRSLRARPGTAGPGWLLAAAAALAFAVLARWASALIVVVALSYAAVELISSARGQARRVTLHVVAAAAVALLVLSPILGPTLESLAGRGETTGHTVDLDVVASTWSPANAFRTSFENSDGRQTYASSNLAFYLLAPARHALLTPIFALALPLGLWRVLRARRMAPILLLVAWPAVVAAFVVGISWQNFRYTLTMLPPLAILAAIGVGEAWRAASGRGRFLVACYVAVGLVWMSVANAWLTERFIDRKNETLELIAWTLERIPEESTLVTFGVTTAFRRYGRRDVEELYALNDRELDVALASGRPLYLLVERESVEKQWGALSPGRNLRHLEAAAGLAAVDRRGAYTLFESVHPFRSQVPPP